MHFTSKDVFNIHKIAKGIPNIIGYSQIPQSVIRQGELRTDLKPCVRFYVNKKISLNELMLNHRIPHSVFIQDANKRIETDVVEIGEMKLLVPDTHTGRTSSLMAGTSIGHKDVTAGTIAGIVFDKVNNTPYILSNRHVFAPIGNAHKGDLIVQPSALDLKALNDPTANVDNQVYWAGQLWKWIALNDNSNIVDAALAIPTFRSWIRYSNSIYQGMKETHKAEVNDLVKKDGRTSHFTSMQVLDTNAFIQIRVEDGKIYPFAAQILLEGTPGSTDSSGSEPGDSGSMIVWEDPTSRDEFPTGLLFAGSETHTMANHIDNVLSELGIKLKPSEGGGFFGESVPWPLVVDDKVYDSSTVTLQFTVIDPLTKLPTQIELTLLKTIESGQNFSVKAKLTSILTDENIIGRWVNIYIKGLENLKQLTKTDDSGTATAIFSGLSSGEYSITASFEGDISPSFI